MSDDRYVNLCYGRDGRHTIESLTKSDLGILVRALECLWRSDETFEEDELRLMRLLDELRKS